MPRRDAVLLGATPPPVTSDGTFDPTAFVDLYRATAELGRQSLLPDALDVQQVAVATNYTLDADAALLVDCTAAGRTVTLPPAAAVPGRIYIIKKVDAGGNNITLTPVGADTIEGVAPLVFGAGARGSRTIISDGVSTWYVIATL